MSSGSRTGTAASDPFPFEVVPPGAAATAYLGLGSNLGDRGAHLGGALRALSGIGELDAVSSVYRSEPVGYADQPDFWNLVVRFRTSLAPASLLRAVKVLEARLGRTPTFTNGPREIDIDLLLYDDVVLEEDQLVVPHPRMTGRAFVLGPLLELDHRLRDPRTGELLAERLRAGGLERIERLFDGVDLLEGRA
jgi:2-amino-4-hydroxy-6-hydroxymethyldihydropteridine diphosphokinase